jgi:hypothetical protein
VRRFLGRAAALALAGACMAGAQAERATWYISPQGDDGAPGTTEQAPFKTFRNAFARMKGGDELVLLDGTYSEAAGTGQISYTGPGPGSGGKASGQAPSGPDEANPTVVRARNPGNVTVEGRLFVGRSFRKDRNIVIDGLTFVGGGHLYNTDHVTLRNCGFHGLLAVGTRDHEQGNERNLIEDVWVWASGERIIAINYRALRNVWRRVVVRGDGCGRSECRGSSNPNVGITVYDSSDVSMQNIIVVDRVLAPGDSPYADFAVAQHTPGKWLFGRNEWLGTISLRAPDQGYYFEPDQGGTVDPTIRISNAIAWDAAGLGFNLDRAGTSLRLENLTARATHHDAVRVGSELTSGRLANVLVAGAGRYGINSGLQPEYVNVHGAAKGAYNLTRCAETCLSRDPLASREPALKHIVRIEEGSFLKGAGARGADIGANVVLRYGREGTRHGDEGFNILTNRALWPWPNEARIKKEMCADPKTRRGFCEAPSLTRYIWDYLGTRMPDDPYAIVRRPAKQGGG